MNKEIEVTTTVEVEEYEGLTMEELLIMANQNNIKRSEEVRQETKNEEKGD